MSIECCKKCAAYIDTDHADPYIEGTPYCSVCSAEMDQGAPENAYGEFICDDCEQNRAEAAYERFCEDFHDGGSTQFKSLREQQIEALKYK